MISGKTSVDTQLTIFTTIRESTVNKDDGSQSADGEVICSCPSAVPRQPEQLVGQRASEREPLRVQRSIYVAEDGRGGGLYRKPAGKKEGHLEQESQEERKKNEDDEGPCSNVGILQTFYPTCTSSSS
jgi:hypothetical protein